MMKEDFSATHSGLTVSELKFFRQLVSDIKLKTAASFVPTNTFHSSISCHSVSHSSPNPWIIDSGASEHMTGNSSLLQSYHYINKTESVRVANGTHVPVHGWGTSNCLPSLPLSSVLHVPSLSVNLLSVHQITEKLNCSVTFFPSHCVFQDLATGKVLGSGKVVDGLYIMEGKSVSPSASYQVDWEGKVALIQCAKAMGIQKFVFFSIHNCDKHPEVPLMNIKYCTEKFLQDSGINHTIIRLCGFMQGLIGQYAVPILEEKSVWGTDAPTRIAYMDTQDIARLTLIALRNEKVNGKLLTFAGPRAWTTQEVIALCERLGGQDANVTTVPVSVLKLTRQLTRLFEWTNDVADRLAFSEVLSSDTVFSVPMTETYSLLGVDSKDIASLEKYLQDYFTNILKKLKNIKAQSKQSDFYI